MVKESSPSLKGVSLRFRLRSTGDSSQSLEQAVRDAADLLREKSNLTRLDSDLVNLSISSPAVTTSSTEEADLRTNDVVRHVQAFFRVKRTKRSEIHWKTVKIEAPSDEKLMTVVGRAVACVSGEERECEGRLYLANQAYTKFVELDFDTNM